MADDVRPAPPSQPSVPRRASIPTSPLTGINVLTALILLLFLAFGIVTFWAANRQDETGALTHDTFTVLLALQRADNHLLASVAEFRLFLEAPTQQSLEAYELARHELSAELEDAQTLSSHEPALGQRLIRVRELANKWQDSAELAIAQIQRNPAAGLEGARRTRGERATLMAAARAEVVAAVSEQQALLRVREEADARSDRWFSLALGGVLAAGLVVGGAVLALVTRLEKRSRELLAENRRRTQAEARANSIVELSPHPLVIVDGRGRIAQVNGEALHVFGYTRAEMLGQSVEMLVPERFRAGHPALRASYAQAPTIRPMGTGRDLFALRKDGSEFPVDISLGPVQHDESTQVIASIVDMTEHARAQAELLEANRAFEQVNHELDAFAYSVAHDLRAPLRGVTGFAELLLGKHAAQLNAEAKDYVARIRQAGNRMALLIDDLLTLSRITRADLRREPVNVTAIALAVLEELHAADPQRHVDYVVQEHLAGSADPRLLRILLDNLLGNAWKFTARSVPARIEFGAAEGENAVVYFVRDNGAGFDMAYADKLFRPFERLHDTREFSGTGIGLATAHRIVSRHGGSIWAESVPGQGTTFYFTL